MERLPIYQSRIYQTRAPNNNNNSNSSPSPSFSSSNSNPSLDYINKEMLELFVNSNNTNRVLAVLADFFSDERLAFNGEHFDEDEDSRAPYLTIDYERGIVVKARQRRFVGKTIVFARNHKTEVLNKECEVAGMGVYGIGYCVSWTGKPFHGFVKELLKLKPREHINVGLCQLMLAQETWKYSVIDLTTTDAATTTVDDDDDNDNEIK